MKSPKADMLSGLIRSMTSNEKRYFRISNGSGEDRSYQKIFDAIDRENIPAKDLKKWQAENAVHTSYEKSYLQKILLRSLRNFYEDATTDTTLYQTLIDVEILFNKKQNDLARSLIKKAMSIAEENENYIILQELIKWQIKIINRTSAHLSEAKEFQSLMELATRCLRYSENSYTYAGLTVEALALAQRKGHMAGDEELAENLKILSHPYFKDESMALTMANKNMFFNIQAICYNNISQPVKAFEMIRRSVSLLEEYPERIRRDPKNYMMMLGNLSAISGDARQPDEAIKALDKLERLPDMKGIHMTDTVRDHIVATVIENKMSIYTNGLAEYTKGIEWYEKTKAQMDKGGIVLNSNAMRWRHYLLAVCLFFTKRYAEALEQLRIYLHDHDDQRSDYLLCVHMLHIMVHVELGHYPLLPHLIRSVRRFADTRGFKEKSISLFLQIATKLAKKGTRKEVSDIAKSYLPKLKALSDLPQEYSVQNSIGMNRWLQAKV